MSFLSLIGIELKKIRRSKIFLILLIPVIMMWIPGIINADMNFDLRGIPITPENNFFIQGFMGMVWFMIPASLVICTVLLNQTERSNKGILKMLSLPISTTKLCLAKFTVLLILAAVQMIMSIGAYYICAAIVTHMKKIKILTAVLLSLCLAFAVTGCSGDNLKDSVINGFNDMLQHFSKYALTDEKDLQGDKTKGEDTYTGFYTADYEDFNDKEYIFGGTALEWDKGSELTVTYELTVDSGTAKLYWLDKGEEKMIADTSKNGTYSVTLDEGDNYLTLEGNDFCGSLQVVVE